MANVGIMGLCTHRVVKIFAIILTILFILGSIQRLADYRENNLEVTIGLILWTIFELILLIVLIFEWRIMLLMGLVVLVFSLVASFFAINVVIIEFAITCKTIPQLKIMTDSEAFVATVILELMLAFVFFAHMIRFLCVYYLYRIARLTIILHSTGPKSNPRITVHTANLP